MWGMLRISHLSYLEAVYINSCREPSRSTLSGVRGRRSLEIKTGLERIEGEKGRHYIMGIKAVL